MKFAKLSRFSTLIAAVVMAGFALGSSIPARAECDPICQQKCRTFYWHVSDMRPPTVGLPDSERLANCINEWSKRNEALRAALIRAGLKVCRRC